MGQTSFFGVVKKRLC